MSTNFFIYNQNLSLNYDERHLAAIIERSSNFRTNNGNTILEAYILTLNRHRSRVAKYFKIINNGKLNDAVLLHDLDKLTNGPIYTAAFAIRDQLSRDNLDESTLYLTDEVLDTMHKVINDCVDFHRNNYNHHAERFNRKPISMTHYEIIELVADWMAVAEDINTDPLSWFDNQIYNGVYDFGKDEHLVKAYIRLCMPELEKSLRTDERYEFIK